ncbi:MAG: MFS transporter [Gammaproteobacteria bacterium]|nr:MFS transporter [Gammaproteobacteria bacterium]MCI0591471.1 MFS transporter [Gammaproteobacteria bacterium]
MPLLGLSSGLPLALTSSTLQAWLTVSAIDIRTIGIFGLVGLPYTVKFLWSPLMDRFVPPWMGRRRGWMLLAQLGLMFLLGVMAYGSPEHAPVALGLVALAVTFLSASQDIAVDAYRADILRPVERGFGAGVFVAGYRVGLLLAGALALIMAEQIGWQATYLVMAGFVTIGLVGTVVGPDPAWEVRPPETLADAITQPFKEFLSRPGAVWLIVLVVLYKLGDAFAGTLTTAFLIRGVGFTLSDVGLINKGLGLASLLIGALSGGAIMVRLGLFRSLLLFGILQAVSNLGFMLLAWVGNSYWLMAFAVAFENFAGGMGTVAFVALLMALCDHRYTATQFALLTALAALGRVFVGPPSGYAVEAIGWVSFFSVTFVVALPGLFVLWYLRSPIDTLDKST